jgi:hypothetical protein
MISPGNVTTKSLKKSAPHDVMAVSHALSEQYDERSLGNKSDPVEELVYISLTRQTHRRNADRSWQAIVGVGGPKALLSSKRRWET